MGKFNNKIEAEFSPPKTWVLSRALSYQNDEMFESALQSVGVKCPASKITCKKGFKTDLASTPKILLDMAYLNVVGKSDHCSAAKTGPLGFFSFAFSIIFKTL